MSGVAINDDSSVQNPAIHLFSVAGKKFALNINGGYFFEIDDLAEEILESIIQGKSAQDISQNLAGKYPEEAVSAAFEEFEEMKANGFLFSEDPFSDYSADHGRATTSLCMMISQDCNLRCRYCYAETGSFGQDRKLMSKEVAEKAVEFLINSSAQARHLNLMFFGGEPLLNFPVLKHTVEYAKSLADRYKKEISFTVTTNGTLLTEPVRDYLIQNRISILISLDGQPEIHDKMRPFADGRGSYQVIYNNLKEMLKSVPNVAVRGTMTCDNLDLERAVRHMAAIGIRDIAVEPCYTANEWPGLGLEDIDALKREYLSLAQAYIEAARKGEYLSFYQFEEMVGQAGRVDLHVNSCGAGVSYLAVSADGKLYPCQRLVGLEEYSLGNVSNGIDRPPVVQLFEDTHVKNKKTCLSCWARYLCGGGCRAYSIRFNKDIYEPYWMDCELRKHLVELGAYIYSELRDNRQSVGTQISLPCNVRQPGYS